MRIFNNLSTKFISFKERIHHSEQWYVDQVREHYELNKLINMNPCKDKFRLTLIKEIDTVNGAEVGFKFLLDLSSTI